MTEPITALSAKSFNLEVVSGSRKLGVKRGNTFEGNFRLLGPEYSNARMFETPMNGRKLYITAQSWPKFLTGEPVNMHDGSGTTTVKVQKK